MQPELSRNCDHLFTFAFIVADAEFLVNECCPTYDVVQKKDDFSPKMC